MIPNVTVPEGKSGDWAVSRYVISEEDAKLSRLRAAIGHPREMVTAGTYTKLTYKGGIVMSDTRQEKRDHMYAVIEAKGQVLISGLGLGMVLQAMLLKENVYHVTVVEISQDVINLVGPHYKQMFGDRLEIICADILEWKPPKGAHYDVVWHDIWDNICGNNWPEMTKLARRFGRYADWQGRWGEYETRRAYNG